MQTAIIENRMKQYNPANKHEELNAFKEIAQELALLALSRAGFFNKAAFLGGTCLRIMHSLPRFSEDLDFSLIEADSHFTWAPYLDEICEEFKSYGLSLKTKDRSDAKGTVRKAFLKEDSFGQVLQLSYQRTRADTQVAQIKLEIDINPPTAAKYEPQILPFPIPYSLTTHQLPTLFSGKVNAILTRGFAKGRDWFDFGWYIGRNESLNLNYLAAALSQFQYPLPDSNEITLVWVKEQLLEKANSIDWQLVKNDVSNLLRERDLDTLDLWNQQYFEKLIDQLA